MANMWGDFYGEDDYELFDDLSEVDEIIGNAMADITSRFKQNVKDAIAEAKECESKLNTYKNELAWLEHQINDKKEEVESLKRKADEAEYTEIPRKYLARMVKSAINSYAPGDKVWTYNAEFIRNDCDACNATGKVRVNLCGKETDVQCPKCKGRKFIDHHNYSPVQKTVSSVNLKLCFYKDRVNYWSLDNIYLNGSDYSTSPNCIFETQEEAQKWCDEQNKKERENSND